MTHLELDGAMVERAIRSLHDAMCTCNDPACDIVPEGAARRALTAALTANGADELRQERALLEKFAAAKGSPVPLIARWLGPLTDPDTAVQDDILRLTIDDDLIAIQGLAPDRELLIRFSDLFIALGHSAMQETVARVLPAPADHSVDDGRRNGQARS